MIEPEMMITLLFCDKMDDHEVIVTNGCNRIISFQGYSSTFRFVQEFEKENVKIDGFERIWESCWVAMDARPYMMPQDQFRMSEILREINKAVAGFSGDSLTKSIENE